MPGMIKFDVLRRANPIVFLAVAVIAFIAIVAIAAPLVAPYSPDRMNVIRRLQPPNAIFFLGTDEFGRDVLSRIIFGARNSLFIGFSVAVVAVFLGTIMGLIASQIRSLDNSVMRFADALMAFPDILLSIAIVAAIGPGMRNLILVLGIIYAPRVARVVRASGLVIRNQPFIEAATSIGATRNRILLRHVLPNMVPVLIVQATFVFSFAILTEAALSFLGVGLPPSTPSWGGMMASAQQVANRAPWLIWVPGIAIAATAVALQVTGDAMRDNLDPKLKRAG